MKLFEITIILLIINSSFQEECTFSSGKCTKANDATFDDKEKICDLNSENNGCILRNVKCSDFDSFVFCSGAKLASKHKKCLYDSEHTPECYEIFEECGDVKIQSDCNGYSPDSLTKCVWDAENEKCIETKCELAEKNNCEYHIFQ